MNRGCLFYSCDLIISLECCLHHQQITYLLVAGGLGEGDTGLTRLSQKEFLGRHFFFLL